MSKKRIGVIGLGQWGPNQLRSFLFHPDAEVVRVCDKDPKRLASVRSFSPRLSFTADFREVTRASDVDAVVVATPVSTHYAITRDALENGKDVLCEKPLTVRSSETEALGRLARSRRRILMVGHVFLFNEGIHELKRRIDRREIGELYYLHAQRTNLGPVRRDVNAVYDLASHDISIFNFLLGAEPKVLGATGKCYLQKGVEDVAYVSLQYPGNILAHIHVSWLDPKKVRQITVVGKKKMMTWDDLSGSGPVEIFSRHVEKDRAWRDFGEFHLLVKEGEVLIPHVRTVEPLKSQAAHFLSCITRRRPPVADAKSAAAVVRALERVERILERSR